MWHNPIVPDFTRNGRLVALRLPLLQSQGRVVLIRAQWAHQIGEFVVKMVQ